MPEVGGARQHDAVVKELRLVPEKRLGPLRRRSLPALHGTASSPGRTTTEAQPVPASIEELIPKAVNRLGGGHYQEAAQYMFGLIGRHEVRTPGRAT
jgi:hypothetical protein